MPLACEQTGRFVLWAVSPRWRVSVPMRHERARSATMAVSGMNDVKKAEPQLSERSLGRDLDEPVAAAQLMTLGIFISMRWIFILGIVVAALVSTRVFDIQFPTLPTYAICIVMGVYNAFLYVGLRGLRKDVTDQMAHKAWQYGIVGIVLDLVTLTALLHYTGGIENPFIFYFVFHIVLASIALNRRAVYALATMAVVLVSALVMLEFVDIVPHVNLAGFVLPTRYKEPSRVVAVLLSLTTIIYVSTYISTAISGELRKRQRQVVQLREQLLQETSRELEMSSQENARLEEDKQRFLAFLGMAAHDLKAPLAAFQSYIGVLLGGYTGELNEKQKTVLQRCSTRLNGLLKLISDLLDIPRIEKGQLIEDMADVSLSSLIEECIQEQRGLADGKGLELRVVVSASLPVIRGSSSRLRQALTNLINNAISYTHAGMVSVRAAERGIDVVVEVSDTGIGIPPADRERLFTDFFRGSNVDSPGTGLGLSITRRIIESHGGSISVESPDPESKVGTRFTFTVPKKGVGTTA